MLRQRILRKQRGDTLIEVLFAISVFSLVVVGALAIMNQGTATSQRSLEITLVRQQIDAQAETLRFMHNSYVAVYRSGITFAASDRSPAAEWSRMLSGVIAANRTSASGVSDCPARVPNGSFALDTVNVRYVALTNNTLPGTNFAQIVYTGAAGTTFSASDGLWIEAIRSSTNTADNGNQTNVGYIDFHIYGCWNAAGSSIPATQGTIVRLYEPRG